MAETKMIVKDLGEVTAYAYAVSKGYTGTEEEFATLMASYATVGQQTADAKDAAVTARNEAEAAKNESVAAKDEAVQAAGDAAKDAKDTIDQILSDVRDNIEQIDQNTLDIADLKETTEDLEDRKANIDGSYPDMTVGNAEQLNSSKFVENSEPYTLRPSGGTSDIGNREYVDAVVGGTLAWNQKVRDEASTNETDFAPIATVVDAVEDAAGVRLTIEPVQDLHGYDHPWPAGGGKNLLPIVAESLKSANTTGTWSGNTYTEKGVTYTLLEDATGNITGINVNGTASENSVFKYATNLAIADGSYVLSGCPSGGSDQTYAQYIYTNTAYWDTGSGVTVNMSGTFSANIRVLGGTTVSNKVFSPMVCLSSASNPTTFEPYSNICPISGWDGVKVTRAGKNLWDKNNYTSIGAYIDGVGTTVVVTNSGHTLVYMPCKPNTTYTISRLRTVDNERFALAWTKSSDIKNGTVLYDAIQSTRLGTVGEKMTLTITTGNDAVFLVAWAWWRDSIDPEETFQIELGSTVTDYESYAGQVYDINLPTEAGTVYGGELTVNTDGSGSLVVDRAEVDAGGLNWSVTNTHCFYSQAIQATKEPNLPSDIPNLICSAYRTDSPSRTYHGDIGDCVSVGKYAIVGAKRIIVYSSSNTDPTTFKASMSGVQLIYELATPITYTLTASQITTLLGTNNVWSDAGQTALTYTGTDEHLTLESGKKYLTRISGTDSMLLGSGQEITAAKGTDNVFDLTQMFGTAVADYVYGQGAAFFRKWFPNAVYPYNAGELKHVEGLQSHDMVGFNQWDEEWESGAYDSSTGEKTVNESWWRSKNAIRVIPETVYCAKAQMDIMNICFYDAAMNFILQKTIYTRNAYATFTVPSDAYYLTFYIWKSTPKEVCINLSHNGSRNGEYEPYEKHSYPLDSSVILRGIPKVGTNGVYWDGDRYLPDGTIERRYGVVDLGTLDWGGDGTTYFTANVNMNVPSVTQWVVQNGMCSRYTIQPMFYVINQALRINNSIAWYPNYIRVADSSYADAAAFKAAMQGVLLVYELDTPTTETAQSYHSTQWVSDWGTEEFVSTSIVPVGSETRYPANLRDKLQHLPDAASGNGSYLITQTDGQMVLTPFPAPPSTAGNYVLKATVTNGVATYTWEVAT